MIDVFYKVRCCGFTAPMKYPFLKEMSNITDEQIRAVFDLFDADGSGFVDCDDLGMALQALGFGVLPQEQIDSMLRERTGEVQLDEYDEEEPLPTQLDFVDFRQFVERYMCKRNSPAELQKAFYLFSGAASNEEQRGDAVVTLDDMLAVCEELGEFIPRGSEVGGVPAEDARRAFLTSEFKQLIDFVRDRHGDKGGELSGVSLEQWSSIMMEAITDKRHPVA